MNLLKKQNGQGLIEYLIIMALMAIATMAIMRVMSKTVSIKFAQVTEALQGKKSSTPLAVEDIQTQHIKKKDMSDFFNGAVSRGSSSQGADD